VADSPKTSHQIAKIVKCGNIRIMIKVIKEINELEDIRECWNALYEEDDNYTPFQSFEYNYISWKRFGQGDHSLFVILYYHNQEKTPCAVFPLCIDSKKCLRFINEDHSDYQTALIKESAKTDLKMYEEVYELVKNQPNIDRICLNHLRHDDLIIPYMGHLSFARIYGTESYSYLPIVEGSDDGEFIDSLRHLSAKERNRLKNIEKKATDLSFKIMSIESDTYPEKDVNELVQVMITKGIRTTAYFTDNLLGFIKDLYQAGVLKIGMVYQGQDIGSISFFYQSKNGTCIQWIIVYSDKVYNLQAKLKIINSVYESGGGIFNFGRGTYAYKIQHFRPIIQNLFCVDIPFRRKARMMLMLNSLKDVNKKIMYNVKKKLKIGSIGSR
jgi:hypothetical protein